MNAAGSGHTISVTVFHLKVVNEREAEHDGWIDIVVHCRLLANALK